MAITINKGVLNSAAALTATAGAASMEVAPVKDSKTVYLFNNKDTKTLTVKVQGGEGWGAGNALTFDLTAGAEKVLLLDGSRFKKNDGKIYFEVSGGEGSTVASLTVTAIQI